MEEIPVTIIYKGKEHFCFLSEVTGAGSYQATKWHLMEDFLYRGSLHWTENRGFWFGGNIHTEKWEDIICEQLEIYILSWYQ